MSTTYQIWRRTLHHEGGTKFYQTFRISIVDPGQPIKAVSAINFGAYRGIKPGSRIRPIDAGQTQVKPGASHQERQFEAKLKGGYHQLRGVEGDEVSTLESLDEFKTELIRLFGATNSHAILLELGLTWHGESFVEPTTPLEDTPIATKEIERPESWGSW